MSLPHPQSQYPSSPRNSFQYQSPPQTHGRRIRPMTDPTHNGIPTQPTPRMATGDAVDESLTARMANLSLNDTVSLPGVAIPKTSPFFRLPTELRLEVYKLLFTNSTTLRLRAEVRILNERWIEKAQGYPRSMGKSIRGRWTISRREQSAYLTLISQPSSRHVARSTSKPLQLSTSSMSSITRSAPGEPRPYIRVHSICRSSSH